MFYKQNRRNSLICYVHEWHGYHSIIACFYLYLKFMMDNCKHAWDRLNSYSNKNETQIIIVLQYTPDILKYTLTMASGSGLISYFPCDYICSDIFSRSYPESAHIPMVCVFQKQYPYTAPNWHCDLVTPLQKCLKMECIHGVVVGRSPLAGSDFCVLLFSCCCLHYDGAGTGQILVGSAGLGPGAFFHPTMWSGSSLETIAAVDQYVNFVFGL